MGRRLWTSQHIQNTDDLGLKIANLYSSALSPISLTKFKYNFCRQRLKVVNTVGDSAKKL
jgi:hypothetical protein